jgi:hypothetical protein
MTRRAGAVVAGLSSVQGASSDVGLAACHGRCDDPEQRVVGLELAKDGVCARRSEELVLRIAPAWVATMRSQAAWARAFTDSNAARSMRLVTGRLMPVSTVSSISN